MYTNGNTSCSLPGTNYNTITTNSAYSQTLTLKGATTIGLANLLGGTLDTAGTTLTATNGRIGTSANATPAFNLIGAGELDVNAGATVTLDNASLDASVRVNNGTVNVGQLTFAGAGLNRWFIVSGPQGNANFGNTVAGTLGAYTSSYKFPAGGAAPAYLQPVVVQGGGSLNFNNAYSVNGFVFNQGGNVNVNAPLTINGDCGGAPQVAGLAPAGVAAGYISVGSRSNLFLNATTITEINQNANGAQNFAAYLESTDTLYVNGPTNSTITGNVDLEGANGAAAGLVVGQTGPSLSTFGLTVSGALTLNWAQVNENITYPTPAKNNAQGAASGVRPDGAAPGPGLPTMSWISCGALTIKNSTYVLVATNPQNAVAFTLLSGISATTLVGDFTYSLGQSGGVNNPPTWVQGKVQGNTWNLMFSHN